MPCIFVDDAADPRLAVYQRIHLQNPVRWAGHFIAEGDKVVERLIASQYPVVSLLVEPSFAARFESALSPDTPIYVGSRGLLEATIGFNFHRGALACGQRLPPLKLEDALAPTSTTSIVLVCPDLKDPTNLGSILRSSAALGVSTVILGPHCADYLSRRVVRVSMAAALQLPIVVEPDIAGCLRRLRGEQGYEIVAAVVDPQAEPLAKAHSRGKIAIVLGSEAHGLPREIVSVCDRRVTIPMQLAVDSLNVAVAAALFLFHFCQRESD